MLTSQESLLERRIASIDEPFSTARCPGARPDISPTKSSLGKN